MQSVRVSKRQVILAVDDMPANLAAVINLLPETCEVRPAKTGKDALDILARSFVDLALLDIEMPDMSGIDLFEQMKVNPDYASIPVIFVTSDNESETVKKVIAMGAKDYIMKPFTKRSLLFKVDHVLRSATQDQAGLFLQRKIKALMECCTSGNIIQAETTIKEIPDKVYSKFVFLKLNRVLSAMHNQRFDEAAVITEELTRDLSA